MSDEHIEVVMTCESRVRYSKHVAIKREEWERYNALVDGKTGLSMSDIDKEIAAMADRYDLDDNANWMDQDAPEDIEIVLCDECTGDLEDGEEDRPEPADRDDDPDTNRQTED